MHCVTRVGGRWLFRNCRKKGTKTENGNIILQKSSKQRGANAEREEISAGRDTEREI